MNTPRTGEVSFKQWASEAAHEAGVTARAMMGRYYAGKIRLCVRRVNQRVVYVQATNRPPTVPETPAVHVGSVKLLADLRKAAQ